MILKFLFQHKLALAVLVFLWLIAAGLATAQPAVMAPIVQIALQSEPVSAAAGESVSFAEVNLNNIDQYVSQFFRLDRMQPWNAAIILSGAFLSVVILGTALETLAFYIFTRVRINTLRRLQQYAFNHLLSLSMDFFNHQRSGSLVSRLEQDTSASVNSFTNILKLATTAPVMAIIYGVMLVRTNLQLMLLVSMVAAAQWTTVRLLRNRIRRYIVAEFDLIAMLKAYLTEIFQNIRVVKSFTAEEFEQVQLSDRFEAMIPVHVNRALSRHLQEPIVTMINAFGNVSILLLSINELLRGNFSVVGFFLFLYIGRAMIQPISQMGQIYLSYQEMTASAARVYEILQKSSSVQGGPRALGEFRDRIKFKTVSFAYADKSVLRNVTIEIKRGETVALVGPSGGGKSTLTDLLLRFYDPSSGNIFIDGTNIRDLQTDSYRRLFGVVTQETLLFNDTVAKNIAYGRNGITKEQIESAAEVANATEFIAEMPDGYQTLVGDRGIRISGGQRQRIAIARAVVHQPEILIMDEATSSLDTESERLVQNAIDRVIQGRTSVVIAHRLSTVINADKIIILQDGRVLDQGRHAELLQRCDLYKRLCELQFQMNGKNITSEVTPQEEKNQ
jgi:subfamily B ATP-binding cassette protein MsbA